MFFVSGIIVGLLLAMSFQVAFLYYQKPIERTAQKAEREVKRRRPKAKGFIIGAPTEAEEAREKIIERNNQLGKDTKLSELYETEENA